MAAMHRLAAFVLTIIACSTNAQQLSFDNYTKNTGLVNNEVHCIQQASNGLMYFGTPAGCSIYDGSQFLNFDIHRGFTESFISGMYERPNGQMLLFTGSGDVCFNITDRRMTADGSLKISGIKNITTGRHKNYMVAFSGVYDVDNDRIVKLPIDRGHSFYGINCVREWQDSLLVVGRSYESLDIYDMRSWKRVASSSEKIFVRDMCEDADGNLWIATIGRGVMLLTKNSLTDTTIQFGNLPEAFAPFRSKEFRAIVRDRENNLWIGGINTGLLHYKPSTKELSHITRDHGLLSNTTFSLCSDREDNLWIGTNNGVQKLTHKDFFLFSSQEGLPADLVLDAIPVSNGRILTCGYSGVGYISSPPYFVRAWYPPLEDEYFTQFESLEGNYFGLSRRQLLQLSLSPTTVFVRKAYPLQQHYYSMTIWEDQLFLGGDSSISVLQNEKIETLINDDIHRVSCMTTDTKGNLWAGDVRGNINAYTLHKINGRITATRRIHIKDSIQQPRNVIQCLAINREGVIAYGSSQRGISILKYYEGKFIYRTNIDIIHGLSSNRVNALTWHNDTTLLAGTSDGLDKIIFRPVPAPVIVHSISSYYNFSNAIYSIRPDSRGGYLLGAEPGLIRIPTVDIAMETDKFQPIIISSVQLVGVADSVIDFDHKKEIVLPYDRNSIVIQYASPSFISEKTTRYVYTMHNGGHEKWSVPRASNSITFLNLSPGNYIFKVKPVNIFGHTSTREDAIHIIVRPAFWQTWWFMLVLIAVGSAIAFWLMRIRIASIRKTAANERQRVLHRQKIAEAEMMALRAQMNPHFIFNCMNIIDGFISNNQRTEAQDFLQKFSKLIRLVLQNSQYPLVPLQEDLQALKLYVTLEAIRADQSFTYTFNIDEELLESDYKIPPLLLQPYVENAIIHGIRNNDQRPGRLIIDMSLKNDQVIIVIADNGIGRKRSRQLQEENRRTHQSMGMNVTEKRIQLLQLLERNDITLKITDLTDDENTGTRVEIILPYNVHM